jgi:hypothetical protein
LLTILLVVKVIRIWIVDFSPAVKKVLINPTPPSASLHPSTTVAAALEPNNHKQLCVLCASAREKYGFN